MKPYASACSHHPTTMIEAILPFAKEGIGIFATVIVAALFYYITTNMTKAFENGTRAFQEALNEIMENSKATLDRFAEESGKGHQMKIEAINSGNDFIRSSMVVCIKENTASNLAVVEVMTGVKTTMDRTNLLLDRVERKMDGH